MTDLSSFVEELNKMMGPISSSKNEIVKPLEPSSVPSSIHSSVPSGTSTKTVKLLLVTTHTNQVNGYSKVAFNLLKELASHKWLSVVHFGTQKMATADLERILPSPVKSIDGSALDKEKQGTGFALMELSSTIMTEKPDVVFIYNDLSIVCAYIESIRKAIDVRTFKIWTYLDITSHGLPSTMIDIINRDVDRVFSFTKGWKDSLKTQGIIRPVDVMPHGVDSKMFRPIPRDVARQTLGLPKDVFLFTSMNKNIPRKRLDLLIMSFVKLMVKYPMKNIFMLIVADKGDRGGFQLFDIFAREIKVNGGTVDMYGNRLLITSKDTCYKDDDINVLYNCGDVGVSCAEGEGFGLCTFEQMSVGVPQIVPDICGYSEYCTKDNSILVKPKARHYLPQAYTPITGQVEVVDTEDFSKAMERYVFDEELRKRHGVASAEMVAKYTWSSSTAVLIKRLRVLQEDDD
jgi:glycosyltransferase involved in cell wall biosynthesis